MNSSNVVAASAAVVSAPADVVVVSSKAERIALFNETGQKIAEAVSTALSTCKSWQDFGSLAAVRFDSHKAERALFIAYAHSRGVDFDGDPANVKDAVRDAICAGIRDQYIATALRVRYKRGDNGALLVMEASDPRPADVTIAATDACISHTSYAHLKLKDKPVWEALTAYRKRIDGRTRVMWSSFFDAGREARKAAAIDSLYSADETERMEAEKAKAEKSATRAKAKPLNVAALAALIDNVIDQIDKAKTAKTIKAPLAQAIADLLIAARAATGIKAKA
ncbi:MAG: hypothetical protein WCO62_00265 [Betaproteobacteria bacterium]